MLKSSKLLLALAFSLLLSSVSLYSSAQENTPASGESTVEKAFNASEVIFHHILDAHEFHFISWKGGDGAVHELAIPLPVILYSKERGVSFFNFSKLYY